MYAPHSVRWLIFLSLAFLSALPKTLSGRTVIQHRLDSLMGAYQDLGWNAVVRVTRGDTLVFTGSIGFSDIPRKIRLDPGAVMASASVGKMFTSTRVMHLGLDQHWMSCFRTGE
jgi:CubicO group peptidase (beta-lactamase class C family)